MPSVSLQQKVLAAMLGLWTALVALVFFYFALTNVNGAQSHKNDAVEMMFTIYMLIGGIALFIAILVWLAGRIWKMNEDLIVRCVQLCAIAMVGISIPISLGAAFAG